MGNEKSQPAGLSIDENATEVSDSWSLHGATYAFGSIPKISVFISNCHGSATTVTQLEKFSKNIMIYRHPCILKYVGSWKKGTKFHLATEQVQPLAQVLPSQTTLQICIGLQSVLKALVFLHESACVSHNNVCRSAVYVSQGGSWKLGGFEFLCRFNDMSSRYLEETRTRRYDPAVSANEAEQLPQPPSVIDCYAFGVLSQEVLVNRKIDDVPGMADFLELCKKQLQSSSPELRPSLSSVLTHQFFCHEFIAIHNFLVDLPIKRENEKQDFFRDAALKLNCFPEEVVASQLGSLLLSRMVLLDSTAQQFLLPQVFIPRKDENSINSLFSENTFRTHMVPRLLPLFCVRDVQVRMILLSHFHTYCHLFSQVQLQTRILPELLVGIKDTNDTIVSTTLRALANLVPILGGAVVIGGKRAKLFADGRPKAVKAGSGVKQSHQKKHSKTESTIFTESVGSEALCLPERPSPDGGEYIPAVTTSEEDEVWPEWDEKGNTSESTVIEAVSSASKGNDDSSIITESVKKLESFQIKDSPKDNFENIFQDMEPVISKPQIVHIAKAAETSNKFALIPEVSENSDGWGDDCDWNCVETDVDNDSSAVS